MTIAVSRILICVQYYLPGFKSGGPIRSIKAIAEQFARECDLSILTFDRDSGDNRPYPGIRANCWTKHGCYRIKYIRKSFLKWFAVARAVSAADVETLYLQSLTHPVFTLVPLFLYRFGWTEATRCVVAPRGELADGALNIHPKRKRVFLWFARLIRLYSDCDWHATNEQEADAIRAHFRLKTIGSDNRIFVAQNLVPENLAVDRQGGTHDAHASSALRVAFLSRIAPMKNLNYAIDVLHSCNARIQFDIYGPVDRDPNYWRKCQEKMSTLPENICANYRGPVSPNEVNRVLAGSDLLFLPTRGENFGHVIAESLLAGCPVLISDQTPWKGLVDADVGWDLSLASPEAFSSTIDRFAAMSKADRDDFRSRAAEYARSRVNSSADIEQHRLMLIGIPK